MKKDFLNRVIEVQNLLKAPKTLYNEFAKFNYRSAEGILEAVKPLLAERGLLLILSDELIHEGDRYYVKATATLTDGEDSIVVSANGREAEQQKGMDAAQITGCASSYSRKYALNGLFLIDDNKDIDAMDFRDTTPATPATEEQQPATRLDDFRNWCKELMNKYPNDKDFIKDWFSARANGEGNFKNWVNTRTAWRKDLIEKWMLKDLQNDK